MSAASLAEARAIAEQWLDVYYRQPGMDAVVIERETMEEPFGWVFFYQSQRWLETGDPAYLIVGNAPIVITRDGNVHMTGTGRPLDELLRPFRQ